MPLSSFTGPIEFVEPKRDSYHDLALQCLAAHMHMKYPIRCPDPLGTRIISLITFPSRKSNQLNMVLPNLKKKNYLGKKVRNVLEKGKLLLNFQSIC